MEVNAIPLNTVHSLRPGHETTEEQLASAREVKETYQQFVGEVFFGQLLKSMRSTQGKPAYFHGGQAEEVFRSQLDQTLAEQMTKSSADKIADPMFAQQFPRQAELLRAEEEQQNNTMADLLRLRRR